MHETPVLLSDRPDTQDEHTHLTVDGIDVMGDILDASHLTTALYGRLELGIPWKLEIPKRPYLSFYVVARGGGWIELDVPVEERPDPFTDPYSLPLSAGDVILLTQGTAHRLRDSEGSSAPPQGLDYSACPGSWAQEAARFGGEGPLTSMVTGHFTFQGSVSRNPLLDTLPPLIHLPANAAATSSQLTGVISLILSESARPGPGGSIVLARLADLLLIHALRYWISGAGKERCGLHAVTDSSIGAALRLMHAHAARTWTVDSLASAVAMSRSAFAARFSKLVGEPPLQYLARWRMTQAARLLSGGQMSVAAVAEHVGYSSPIAFSKAFARFQGVGPGGYRRAHRVPTDPGNTSR